MPSVLVEFKVSRDTYKGIVEVNKSRRFEEGSSLGESSWMRCLRACFLIKETLNIQVQR